MVKGKQRKQKSTYTWNAQAQQYLHLRPSARKEKLEPLTSPDPVITSRCHGGHHKMKPIRPGGLTRWCRPSDDMRHENAERRVERTVIPAKVPLEDEVKL